MNYIRWRFKMFYRQVSGIYLFTMHFSINHHPEVILQRAGLSIVRASGDGRGNGRLDELLMEQPLANLLSVTCRIPVITREPDPRPRGQQE